MRPQSRLRADGLTRERASSLWKDPPSEEGWGSSYDPGVLAPRINLRRLSARGSTDPEHTTRQVRIFALVRLFCAFSGAHTTLRIAENSFTTLLTGPTSSTSNPAQPPLQKLSGTTPWAWSTTLTKTHDMRSHRASPKLETDPRRPHMLSGNRNANII